MASKIIWESCVGCWKDQPSRDRIQGKHPRLWNKITLLYVLTEGMEGRNCSVLEEISQIQLNLNCPVLLTPTLRRTHNFESYSLTEFLSNNSENWHLHLGNFKPRVQSYGPELPIVSLWYHSGSEQLKEVTEKPLQLFLWGHCAAKFQNLT